MKRFYFFLVIGWMVSCSCLARMKTPLYKASSPDKAVCFILENQPLSDGSHQLSYRVTYKGKTVVRSSKLGLQMDGVMKGRDVSKPKTTKKTIDETYTLKSGKQLQTRNHCIEYSFSFKDKNKRPFQVIVRAYDNGVAFRYRFPEIDNNKHIIQKEFTEFSIPQGKAWIHPYDWNGRLKPSYEQFSQNGIQVGAKSPYEQGWAFPMLFQTGSGWTMVTEACLDGSYPATHIDNSGTGGAYKIRFPEAEEVVIPDDPQPCSTLPWQTPWRVIITGKDLNTIFSSQMVAHLNPPSVLSDTDWIKPGKATWSWWYSGATVRQYNEQLKYVDFCSEMGLDYSLIDAGWQQMDGEGMEGVVRYANKKGVGIWLWYHSGAGREGAQISDDVERLKEFKRISLLGVKGVKVDFFDTDKQRIIVLYPAILKDAAACHLMVDFHGATLPRGWERTYPHLMTTEAIKGAESLGRQEVCDRMAEHNATVVFTRNVVGSMDYTPVTFSNKIRQGVEAFRRTSVAHQLALSVAFESGFHCFADRAEGYQSLPEGPKNFLKQVPAAWDESRLLAGYPSDYAVIARRKGNEWYIGGINGKDKVRELRFSLPASCKGKMIRWIMDGADINTFHEESMLYVGGDVKIKVLGNGGFVGRIAVSKVNQRVAKVLSGDILQLAERNVVELPVTVTASVASRSAGGIHDFYSEGDYWWPNPEDPDGPYIRRDGQTNPDNFVAHRHAMVRLSMIIGNLTSAYLLTKEHRYVDAIVKHLEAWFINPQTLMNPNLLYGQAIKGVATGRGIGIIDTLQLIEVAQSVWLLHLEGVLPNDCYEGVKRWFSDYLQWMTTHPYGVDEMNAKNNHGTCWAVQAAAFARLTGNNEVTALCKARFKQVFLPNQMAVDGSFPQELARTKPYSYSLFNLDAMAALCEILSTPSESLWTFKTDDGKTMKKAVDFICPYVKNKNSWPYPHDVMYWDEWPVAQPSLLFAWQRFGNEKYWEAWVRFNHFPTNEEVVRNLPIRNPLIWLYK